MLSEGVVEIESFEEAQVYSEHDGLFVLLADGSEFKVTVEHTKTWSL
jgi:hypothetical protein